MAFHNLVRPLAVGISLLVSGAAVADEKAKANTLTPKEVKDGWVLLFDGEFPHGWSRFEAPGGKEPEFTVKDGAMVVSGTGGGVRSDYQFRFFDLRGEYRSFQHAPQFFWCEDCTKRGSECGGGWGDTLTPGQGEAWVPFRSRFEPKLVRFGLADNVEPSVRGATLHDLIRFKITLPEKQAGRLEFRNLKVRPFEMKPLFNGKDLSGWTVYKGDPKRERSKFTVTDAGELSLKDGPGDLQTEKQYDDFVLQLECKTNGTALNSGVFFRCLPGQYQQGYEAQIQNAFTGNDRTKPADFGTGAIYRRVKARKVVSNDNEWFTMTVLARGPHLATWVNGVPVVNWTDDRPPAENARNGLYTKKGPISIQGHDPTTDLLFRNIRIAELK